MKNLIKMHYALITIAVMVSSCSSYKTSSCKLNIVSTRNIDNKTNYVLLKSYSGGSKREIRKALRKTRANNVEDAVDETLKNVAGGEYLMNAKIHFIFYNNVSFRLINLGRILTFRERIHNLAYYIEGDVWGIVGNENFRGFRIGDIVQWKELGITRKGELTGFVDSENCMVREDGKENSRSVKFSSIQKVID